MSSNKEGYALAAQIGANFGVHTSSQGDSLFYNIPSIDYETKQETFNHVIEVDLSNEASPIVSYTEAEDSYISKEDYEKLLNIIGYCAYHRIKFILNDKQCTISK